MLTNLHSTLLPHKYDPNLPLLTLTLTLNRYPINLYNNSLAAGHKKRGPTVTASVGTDTRAISTHPHPHPDHPYSDPHHLYPESSGVMGYGPSLSSSSYVSSQTHGQGLGQGLGQGPGSNHRQGLGTAPRQGLGPEDLNNFVLSSLPLQPSQLAKAQQDVHRFYTTDNDAATRPHGNQESHKDILQSQSLSQSDQSLSLSSSVAISAVAIGAQTAHQIEDAINKVCACMCVTVCICV